jgi:hypothetical protein
MAVVLEIGVRYYTEPVAGNSLYMPVPTMRGQDYEDYKTNKWRRGFCG